MQRITIDPALASCLGDARDAVELFDTSGRSLGIYVPTPANDCYIPPEKAPELYKWAREQFSDADLERSMQEPGGYTTAEVLAYLASLK